MLNSIRSLDPRRLSPSRLLSEPNAPRFLRQAVIVIATLALAYNFGRQPSLTYVYLPVVLVAVWLLYRYPGLAILSLVGAAILIPFTVGTSSSGSPLNVAYLGVPVLLAFWLVDMVRARSIQLAPSSTTMPLMGLVVAATLSLVVGNLPWNVFAQLAPLRAQVGAWGIFAFSAGAFWLTANRIRDLVWLKRIVWLFLGLGAVFMFARLSGSLSIRNLFAYGVDGSMFWVWIVVLAAGQALFNTDLLPRWRLALGGLVVVTFLVALSPASRGWASGWVPPLVGLALLVGIRWPRSVVLLGLIAALLALIEFPTVLRLINDYKAYDLLTRGAALTIVLEIFKANPLLGVGPANYYFYTPLYPILGYYVRFNSHNNYIDILAQTGLIGMFFFAWFVAAVGRLGWSLRTKFTDGFARGYLFACLAGLLGSLVAAALGDWLLPFVYNIGINGFRASVLAWLFLGGVVALEQIARQKTAPALP